MLIYLLIFLVIGISVGTYFSLWISFALLVIFLIFFQKKESFDQMYLFIFGSAFFIGILIGNISYAIQTNKFEKWNIPNPYVVNESRNNKEKIMSNDKNNSIELERLRLENENLRLRLKLEKESK